MGLAGHDRLAVAFADVKGFTPTFIFYCRSFGVTSITPILRGCALFALLMLSNVALVIEQRAAGQPSC
jgi:hypothetical protein